MQDSDLNDDSNSISRRRTRRSSTSWHATQPTIVHSPQIDLETLQEHFHLPITDVAKKLGVCATVLKKICRKNGISRWPHRKIKSLDKAIAQLEATKSKNPHQQTKILEELSAARAAREQLVRNPSGTSKQGLKARRHSASHRFNFRSTMTHADDDDMRHADDEMSMGSTLGSSTSDPDSSVSEPYHGERRWSLRGDSTSRSSLDDGTGASSMGGLAGQHNLRSTRTGRSASLSAASTRGFGASHGGIVPSSNGTHHFTFGASSTGASSASRRSPRQDTSTNGTSAAGPFPKVPRVPDLRMLYNASMDQPGTPQPMSMSQPAYTQQMNAGAPNATSGAAPRFQMPLNMSAYGYNPHLHPYAQHAVQAAMTPAGEHAPATAGLPSLLHAAGVNTNAAASSAAPAATATAASGGAPPYMTYPFAWSPQNQAGMLHGALDPAQLAGKAPYPPYAPMLMPQNFQMGSMMPFMGYLPNMPPMANAASSGGSNPNAPPNNNNNSSSSNGMSVDPHQSTTQSTPQAPTSSSQVRQEGNAMPQFANNAMGSGGSNAPGANTSNSNRQSASNGSSAEAPSMASIQPSQDGFHPHPLPQLLRGLPMNGMPIAGGPMASAPMMMMGLQPRFFPPNTMYPLPTSAMPPAVNNNNNNNNNNNHNHNNHNNHNAQSASTGPSCTASAMSSFGSASASASASSDSASHRVGSNGNGAENGEAKVVSSQGGTTIAAEVRNASKSGMAEDNKGDSKDEIGHGHHRQQHQDTVNKIKAENNNTSSDNSTTCETTTKRDEVGSSSRTTSPPHNSHHPVTQPATTTISISTSDTSCADLMKLAMTASGDGDLRKTTTLEIQRTPLDGASSGMEVDVIPNGKAAEKSNKEEYGKDGDDSSSNHQSSDSSSFSDASSSSGEETFHGAGGEMGSNVKPQSQRGENPAVEGEGGAEELQERSEHAIPAST